MPIPLLGYLELFTFFIPAGVAAQRYKRLRSELKALAIFCFAECVVVILEYLLGRYGINNRFLANIYVPIEFTLLGSVFLKSTRSVPLKRFFIACLVVFTGIWAVDTLFFAEPLKTNTEMALLARGFLILTAILIIGNHLKDESVALVDKSIFWIASAVILYCSGTFIVFGISNVLLKTNVSHFMIVWHINWVLIILANLLYTRAFFCRL